MAASPKLGKLLAALLCVFLAFLMTAEAAHIHADGSPDAIHCSFCAAPHVAVSSAPSWLTGYVLRLIGAVTIGEPSRGSRMVVPTAFIRPPPAVASSLV
jgi:hypothetical protein